MATVSQSTATPKTLRWWPAAILVGLILGLPYLPGLFEAPGLPIFMAAFMGPALMAILILLWWVAISRSTLYERLVGAVLVILMASASMIFSDLSMQGMGGMIHILPTGALAFAIPLILLAAKPQLRLPVALLVSLVTFCFWDLVRSNGVDGRFQSDLAWRWDQTAEQRHLQILAEQKPSSDAVGEVASLPPVNFVTAQWSAFRGPHRDGVRPGLVLNTDWKAQPPKQLWTATIGPAWSSFTVADQRLFTQEQRGEKEAVVCLHADTGKTLWSYEVESRFWEAVAGAGPRATPTLAEEGLFTLGAGGVLLCLDPNTGQLKWRRDLASDARPTPPTWGFSASPLVIDGKVIVHAGGQDNKGVLAYDVRSGEPIWTVASGDHSYSSAQLATIDSVTGVLMETNAGLQFLDVQDGKTIWEYAWPMSNYRALQPLVKGNVIYLAAALGEGIRKLKVAREEDKWQVTEVWTSRDLKPDFNDFVEHKGTLYGFDGNIFGCSDAETGKRKWKKGRYGNGQVLLLPDGDQLLITSEKGDLVLVKADPEQFVELAKIHAVDGKTWNHPVVVGNRVYIRNDQQAACFELPIVSGTPSSNSDSAAPKSLQ